MTFEEVISILEDVDTPADVYIEPSNDDVTDKDSTEEDEGGLVDNLSGKQLSAAVEVVLLDGRRTGKADVNSDYCSGVSSNTFARYKAPRWLPDISLSSIECIFPEANYSRYRDFSLLHLFELFFDEEVWAMIVDQSIIYANSKGEMSFTMTQKEIKVFFAILLVSGLVHVPSRRLFGEILQ